MINLKIKLTEKETQSNARQRAAQGFQGITFTRNYFIVCQAFPPLAVSCNAARSPGVPGPEGNATLERL